MVTPSTKSGAVAAGIAPLDQARALGRDAWEALLVAHYLRSDGPFGSTPLQSLDATPVELANATSFDGLDPENAKRSFLRSFGPNVTRHVLRTAVVPRTLSAAVPGYFRYLVLSALVPTLSPQETSTRDFRERLGELLGLNGPLSDVGGLPVLWQRLSSWCDGRRADAQPYRRIVLPDPGHMTLIGYSVRLAFPSWRDRDRLTRDVERIGPARLEGPRDVIAFLKHTFDYGAYSASMKSAFGDFYERFQSGERLLSHHRFWRLLRDVRAQVEKTDGARKSAHVARLVLCFGVDDYDLSMEFTVVLRPTPESAVTPESEALRIEGSVEHVLHELESFCPRLRYAWREVEQSVASGILLFTEENWGQWLLTKPSEIRGARVFAVVRGDIARRRDLPKVTWRAAGGEWLFSALDPGAIELLLPRIDRRSAGREDELATLEVIGGVQSGNVYLGRPRTLPGIRATASSRISIVPVGAIRGCMGIEAAGADTWELSATAPVAGVWRVTAAEPSALGLVELESEQNVRFDDRAIEHVSLADPDRDPASLEPEREITFRHGDPLELRGSRRTSVSVISDERLTDLLEALYARGRSGWAESDLLALIRYVNGADDAPRPWDLLRVLQEAGWIEPRQLTQWRGRRWFLRKLGIVVIGTGPAAVSVLDGSTPLVVQERFCRVAEAHGGHPVAGIPVGSWSPPLIAVRGADPVALGETLGIPVRHEQIVEVSPAPSSWPIERRSAAHRELAGIWSWKRGAFAMVPNPEKSRVRLERYRRARGDDRDVFLVTPSGGEPQAFTARASAIMEAHRLAERALFEFDGTLLRRQARDGSLPEPIARMLRFEHLVNPGLLPDRDGVFALTYRADRTGARMLAGLFGRAIAHGHHRTPEDSVAAVAFARHRSCTDRFMWRERLVDPRSAHYASGEVE